MTYIITGRLVEKANWARLYSAILYLSSMNANYWEKKETAIWRLLYTYYELYERKNQFTHLHIHRE